MIAAFLLGITGSLGHCVGMCSGIALLLGRRGATQGWRLLLVHLGRITSYSFLGSIAGSVGYVAHRVTNQGTAHHAAVLQIPGLSQWQGGLAVATAVLALYMALAILGYAPSPELYFVRLTRRWGQAMRTLTSANKPEASNLVSVFVMGLLWGLLPCGLVLTALLTAVVTGSPLYGALTMLAFGVGTWPVPIGIGLMSRKRDRQTARFLSLRYGTAVIVILFGTQMALRGFAAWGWVSHLHLGSIALW
jgi:sulfite exporter TauE/SafE